MPRYEAAPDFIPITHDITKDSVHTLCSLSPKRRIINEHSILNVAPNQHGPYTHFINLPFREVGTILTGTIDGIQFFKKNEGKFWRGVADPDELKKIENWCASYKDIVFIRSLLGCMLALRMYSKKNGNQTEKTNMGKAIHKLKYHNKNSSLLAKLGACIAKSIAELPHYCDSDAIACIPPTDPNKFCLPKELATAVAKELKIMDLSSALEWKGKKKKLKNIEWDNRWDILEESDLGLAQDHEDRIKAKKIGAVPDNSVGVSVWQCERAV